MVRMALALCAVVLTGCAHTFVDGKAGPPADAGCQVNVLVLQPGSAAPRLQVNPDPVPLSNCPGKILTWHVTAAGYGFHPSNGIAFGKNGNPSPGSCPPASGGDRYSCDFTGVHSGTYAYSVTVDGPGSPPTLDPSVIID